MEKKQNESIIKGATDFFKYQISEQEIEDILIDNAYVLISEMRVNEEPSDICFNHRADLFIAAKDMFDFIKDSKEGK